MNQFQILYVRGEGGRRSSLPTFNHQFKHITNLFIYLFFEGVRWGHSLYVTNLYWSNKLMKLIEFTLLGKKLSDGKAINGKVKAHYLTH